MNTVSARKQELEHKISDLESSLADMKQRLCQEIESEQHRAIDHLEVYLEEVDHKYTNMRELLMMLITEIRHLLHGDDSRKEDQP